MTRASQRLEYQKRKEEANVTPPTNRRKSRLVNRQFQLGLAWRMLFVFLLLFAAGILLVFAPSMIGLITGKELAELESASQEFLTLHRRVWPAVLLVLAGVFVYTILVSHRIAGPIYRINAVLQTMLQGEYPENVTLRKGDHFQETAGLLEQLSRKIARKNTQAAPGGPAPPSESGEAK